MGRALEVATSVLDRIGNLVVVLDLAPCLGSDATSTVMRDSGMKYLSTSQYGDA